MHLDAAIAGGGRSVGATPTARLAPKGQKPLKAKGKLYL